ncbi:MAG TPA: CbiX/SirB N-terminal domain-containing protein [Verrucomicrobiae bacterium]|nr:CbiX/SirB N-terminal domain-containing protein [Verrucomicrobiae bacterium]
MKAVLLVSHGSRSAASKRENLHLAEVLKARGGFPVVQCAFLEAESPSVPEGIEACVKQGASEIVILLNFLNSGNHVLKDIPALVEAAAKNHPGIKFCLTPPVGIHPGIADLFLDLIAAAEKKAS